MKPANDVLRRKLRADRPEPEEQAMSPARAVRVALSRAADQAFSMALRVGSIRQSRLDLTDVVAAFDESWALFPIVHDDGSVGALCADPLAVVAFVEQQTMGQMRSGVATERDLTRTDRALAQPLADLFLRLFDETLEGAPTAYWTQGYRADDPVATRHMMALKLEATEFRAFDIALDFVGTQRHGQMLIILPIKTRVAPAAKTKSGQAAQSAGSAKPVRLRDAALPAQVELEAVLCRIKLPLSELRNLAPGKTLNISRKSMQNARLEDLSGQTSIQVHLGQLHGARAVRVAASSGARREDWNVEDLSGTAMPASLAAPAPGSPLGAGASSQGAADLEIDAQTAADHAQADADLEALLSEI